MRRMLSVLVGLCCAVVVFAIVAFPRMWTLHVELGHELPDCAPVYLWGLNSAIQKTPLDLSNVDVYRIGSYDASAKIWFFRFRVPVEVSDTAGPEIEPSRSSVVLLVGEKYSPVKLVSTVFDYSSVARVTVKCDGKESGTVRFDKAGKKNAVVRAVDEWGNVSERKVTFIVDAPPMFVGPMDRHLPVGTDFDVSRAIAFDETDGRLTEKVTADVGNFNPMIPGVYPVTYTVADRYGFSASKTVNYIVCSAGEYRRYADETILTPEELTLLCEGGYFGYEPLKTEDYDRTVALMEPTLVNLLRISSGHWHAGSGAVLDITPEYVYFVSVEHVVKDVCKGCRITFWNGTEVNTKFEYATSNQKNELAVFAVPTRLIPTDTLLWLRQLHADPSVYDTLQVGDSVVAFAKYWNGTKEDKIGAMTVRNPVQSIIHDDLCFENCFVETDDQIMKGMSGTAVVDYHGNLIGLVSFMGSSRSGYSGSSAYHSRIDVLSEAMENLRVKLAAE